MATVPIFGPDGGLVDVPYDQLQEARSHGGKIGVRVKDPQGVIRIVPADRMKEATDPKIGAGQLLPYEEQEVSHPGFWNTALEDALSVPKGLLGMLPPVQAYQGIKHGLDEYHSLRDTGKSIEQTENEQLKSEGYGPIYRWLTRHVAQGFAGVDAAGMEQSAREGDEGGVWGHTVVPAAMATAPIAGEAAARTVRKIPRTLRTAPIRAAVRATETAISPAAKALRIFTPADEAVKIKLPGRDYGLPPEQTPVYPGAPLPEAPPVDAGAPLPAMPAPEQINPALVSPARTLPGQVPPELTPEGFDLVWKAERAAEPIPARDGLALPPAREVGSAAGAKVDTDFFGQARAQLGQDAPLSKVVELAQDFKMGRATPGAEPVITAEAPRVASGESIPRTLSGDSALRQILTGQDNANLMKIAKSRGINVTREAQLRPGFADNLLVNKIISDFSEPELQNIRDTFLESKRFRHQFGDVGPEAWKTMSLQTYFPEVKIPFAAELRTRMAIDRAGQPPGPGAGLDLGTKTDLSKAIKKARGPQAKTTVPAAAEVPAEGDLTDILQKSLDQAQQKPASEGEQRPPFVEGAAPESSTTYGKQNKIVSEADAAAARKNLRNKLFRSNMGPDPTALADAVKLGAYHVEAGIREFGAWSKQMIDELGPEIRPHLAGLWEQVKPFELTSQEPDVPMFYSKAGKVIDEKVGGSAPGDAILATLRNNGVKAQEIEWSGLDEFLQGKKKVTKQEVKQFIDENQIKLEETTLGGGVDSDYEAAKQKVSDARANVSDLHSALGRELVRIRENNLLRRELGPPFNHIVEGPHSWIAKDAQGNDLGEVGKGTVNGREEASDYLTRYLHRQTGSGDEIIRPTQLDIANWPWQVREGRLSITFLPSRGAQTIAQELMRASDVLTQAELHFEGMEPETLPSKYEQYTEPGDKSNYREMLLRLPDSEPGVADLRAKHADAEVARAHYLDAGQPVPDDVQQRFLDAQEALRKATQETPQRFKSGHFDQPNILAHVRFDDRIAPDGKKVLFVEEVQSDWHQKGKQRGYQKLEPTFEVTVNGKPISAGQTRAQAEHTVGGMKGATYAPRLPAMDFQIRQTGTVTTNSSGVPDAPFKSDWHELAMKRMLRHAAENGYDRIAWTTGEQQAARYDLSKHIGRLEYDPETQELTAWDPGGSEVLSERHVSDSELPDYIGKEAAEKLQRQIDNWSPWSEPDYHIVHDGEDGYVLMNGDGEEVDSSTSMRELERTRDQMIQDDQQYWESENTKPGLDGLDLKVGGEWAAALYDRAIPNFLNKYVKKWGAKVGKTEINTPRADYVVEQNPENGMWQVRDVRDDSIRYESENHSAAERIRENFFKEQPSGTPVHSLDITPAMKKSVLKEGQPISKRKDEELFAPELASA